MDINLLLVILGGILIFVGLFGCLIPILPGPIIAWASLPLLLLTSEGYVEFDQTWFIVLTLLMIAVTIVDFLLPIWGSKLTGGTNAGKIGSAIGLVLGLFCFGPFGLLIGPFIGAFIGELSVNNDLEFAFKSSVGSLIGFLLGTMFKVFAVLAIGYHFVDWVI